MLARHKQDRCLQLIPVMMLTAEGGRGHMSKVMEMGACDYILKPFKASDIVVKVEGLFRHQSA